MTCAFLCCCVHVSFSVKAAPQVSNACSRPDCLCTCTVMDCETGSACQTWWKYTATMLTPWNVCSRPRRLCRGFQHDEFLSFPVDCGVVVISWTDITVLCVPFVPCCLVELWFSKFGWSCPSGSRKMQRSAAPSATVVRSTSSPNPPTFLLARGIARRTTKRASVMLMMQRTSSSAPLSRHLSPTGTLDRS